MGLPWRPPDRLNAKGYYEDIGLHVIRLASFGNFFDTEGKNSHSDRVRMLREWMNHRSKDGPVIGGKNPHLCKMVPDMDEAWPTWKAIVVFRPAEEVAASIPWFRKMPAGQRTKKVTAICANCDHELTWRHVKTLYVAFRDVLATPRDVALAMAAFCGITPTRQQLLDAEQFVVPSLSRHSPRS